MIFKNRFLFSSLLIFFSLAYQVSANTMLGDLSTIFERLVQPTVLSARLALILLVTSISYIGLLKTGLFDSSRRSGEQRKGPAIIAALSIGILVNFGLSEYLFSLEIFIPAIVAHAALLGFGSWLLYWSYNYSGSTPGNDSLMMLVRGFGLILIGISLFAMATTTVLRFDLSKVPGTEFLEYGGLASTLAGGFLFLVGIGRSTQDAFSNDGSSARNSGRGAATSYPPKKGGGNGFFSNLFSSSNKNNRKNSKNKTKPLTPETAIKEAKNDLENLSKYKYTSLKEVKDWKDRFLDFCKAYTNVYMAFTDFLAKNNLTEDEEKKLIQLNSIINEKIKRERTLLANFISKSGNLTKQVEKLTQENKILDVLIDYRDEEINHIKLGRSKNHYLGDTQNQLAHIERVIKDGTKSKEVLEDLKKLNTEVLKTLEKLKNSSINHLIQLLRDAIKKQELMTNIEIDDLISLRDNEYANIMNVVNDNVQEKDESIFVNLLSLIKYEQEYLERLNDEGIYSKDDTDHAFEYMRTHEELYKEGPHANAAEQKDAATLLKIINDALVDFEDHDLSVNDFKSNYCIDVPTSSESLQKYEIKRIEKSQRPQVSLEFHNIYSDGGVLLNYPVSLRQMIVDGKKDDIKNYLKSLAECINGKDDNYYCEVKKE